MGSNEVQKLRRPGMLREKAYRVADRASDNVRLDSTRNAELFNADGRSGRKPITRVPVPMSSIDTVSQTQN
jgi:hypothetical protein